MIEQEPTVTILFGSFFKKINTCEFTAREFEEYKDQPIGHGKLSEFVNANISVGNFEWKKNKLFNTQKRNFLDLGDKDLRTLYLRAVKAGLSEVEYAGKIVAEALSK